VRTGMHHFWAAQNRVTPRLRVVEGLPIAALLAACIGLTVQAEFVMGFTQTTAQALHTPHGYVRTVMEATPVPAPHRQEAR